MGWARVEDLVAMVALVEVVVEAYLVQGKEVEMEEEATEEVEERLQFVRARM